MTNEIINKSDSNEGIVIIDPQNKNNDNYHIKSSVHDYLILQICSLQPMKEDIIGCIEEQQQQLMTNHKFTVMDYVGASFLAITAFLICLSCIKYLFSKRGD